jgi:hypothetical protein
MQNLGRKGICLECSFCIKKKAGWFSPKEKLFCEKTNKVTDWAFTCEGFWRAADEIINARYESWIAK